jgi:hypothetical protein
MAYDGMPYQLWVNEERTVLVRLWPGGQMEVCTRGERGAIWSPPIVMKLESV